MGAPISGCLLKRDHPLHCNAMHLRVLHELIEGEKVAVDFNGVGLFLLFAVRKYFRHGVLGRLISTRGAFAGGSVNFIQLVVSTHTG